MVPNISFIQMLIMLASMALGAVASILPGGIIGMDYALVIIQMEIQNVLVVEGRILQRNIVFVQFYLVSNERD